VTRTVTATEAKAKILALLDDVAKGEGVSITKRGKVVAGLVPAGGGHALKGTFAGIVTTTAPDDQLFSAGVVWNLV